MPGPSLMLRVLSDVSALGTSMGTISAKAGTAASGMKSAFSGALATLNNTGVLGPFGNTIAQAQQSLSGMGGSMKSTSDKMMGLGAAGLTAGIILQKAGSADQAAHQQLQAAVTATGHSYDQYAGKVDAAIKHQENFGHTAVSTQNALQTLTQITGNPTKALQLLSTASDVAAAKHIDLASAANMVGKAYEGNTKVLKQFGITSTTTGSTQQQLTKDTTAAQKADTALNTAKRTLLETQTADASSKSMTAVQALKLQDAQDKVSAANLTATTAHQKLTQAQKDQATGAAANTKAMDELSKKVSGQATASVNTFAGHMDVLKTKIEDQTATIGQKYGPALTKAGAVLTGLGGVMKVAQGAQNAFHDSTILTTAATDAQKVATVTATAATKIATAGQWLFNAAMDANPIVLIAALIAIVLVGAILLIITHFNDFKKIVLDVWDAIKKAFGDAVDFMKAHWEQLAAVLLVMLGPIGIIAAAFLLFHKQIIGLFEDLIGYVTGLPGRFASAGAHMWDWIWDTFKAVLNTLIDGWNSLKFTTPSVDILGIHTPSVTLGVPQIPHLAEGGLITKTGLVYAHAGEAITPAPSFGPAVQVGTQHFHSEVELDAFMRRAAWLARTRRGGALGVA
jgi:hypothetical protein